MGRLSGRVALVTGASRGLGRVLALGLANEGAAVAVVARSRPRLEEVAAEIRTRGGRSAAIVADQMDGEAVQASVRQAVEALGPVDVLVNNAGENDMGPFTQTDPLEWWRLVELNLRGPYLYCRAVLGEMIRRRWGRIINIGSVASKIGVPNASAYATAKHGLIGLTRSLALEVAKQGITVNAICPAWMPTDMTAHTTRQRAQLAGLSFEAMVSEMQRRIPRGTSADVADMVPFVLFLASEESGWMTGEAMNTSGGQVMH